MNRPWDKFPSLKTPLTSPVGERDANGIEKVLRNSKVNSIAIIGTGLAGCWLARILAEQGIAVTVYEKRKSVGSAASGNPAGIAKPFVTRGDSLAMFFHCVAHQYLLNRLREFNLEAAAKFTSCGVLQLVEKPYPASDSFTNLSALEATDIAGLSLDSHALNFTSAGWLNPERLCNQLVLHPLITVVLGKKITSVLTHKLEFEDGESAYVKHAVLATGFESDLIPDTRHLPITAARGQISRFSLSEKTVAPKCVVNGKHYVIPDGRTLLVGASFHRDNTETTVTDVDHAANLAGLRKLLPTLAVDPQAIAGYAGVRATTPDRLPIVGPLPDFSAAAEVYSDIRHGRPLANYPELPCHTGIYVLGGLGSRGIVTAPLCAQLLADHLTQAHPDSNVLHATARNSDEPRICVNVRALEYWAALLNPARFLVRHLKRNQ